MSEIPEQLRYTAEHEWLREEEDGTWVVGVTDHAQASLGELVYVELPDEGGHISQGDPCAVVESVKAASDVYAPLSGEIVEVNDVLVDAPEKVNQDPYGDGWLFRVRPEDDDEQREVLDADGYRQLLQEDEEE